MEDVFISPQQHIEMNYRRALGKIKQYQNIQLRDPTFLANTANLMENTRLINEECQTLRDHQRRIRDNNTALQIAITQKIGTGCQCGNKAEISHNTIVLQDVFGHFTNLAEAVVSIVIEYLPENTTPRQTLSPQQLYVLGIITTGANVFFSGKAGVGKSLVLNTLVKLAELSANVFFTALTGIAAINISGSTLHAFAGIGNVYFAFCLCVCTLKHLSDRKR